MKKLLNIVLALVLVLAPVTSQASSNGQPILGPATTTVEKMKDWARSKEANQEFINQAQNFYDISVKYGVDPAVTYAQSAKETNFFKFTGVLTIDFKNTCGLKITAGGDNYDPDAHKRFASWEEGITAQVHHLALYAGHKDFPKADSPDPRHFSWIYNVVGCVEELGGRWAPSKTYGIEVVDYMRQFANVTSTYKLAEPEPVKAEVETSPKPNLSANEVAGPEPVNLPQIKRIFGDNRNKTSLEIAKVLKDQDVERVILAPEDGFTNALVASSLSEEDDSYAPVILVGQNANKESLDLIDQIKPEEIYIVASESQISAGLAKTLGQKGYEVKRFSGKDKYATANIIADLHDDDEYILVNGDNFADAVSASAYAAKEEMPILFTNGKTLDKQTATKLKEAEFVLIIGGPNSVSKAVENEIAKTTSVRRLAGQNRYETSVEVAKNLYPKAKNYLVATGGTYPDSLSGAPLAAKMDAPILLSPSNSLPSLIGNYLKGIKLSNIIVLGGNASIRPDVYKALAETL